MAQTPDVTPHDWLDHVWGWSQFAGAIIAIVAFLIAWGSWRLARDAASSSSELAATASEELRMLKEAASRRPKFEVTLSEVSSPQPGSAAFRVGVRNTGDVDAPNTYVTIIAPTDSQVLLAKRLDFSGEENRYLEPTSEYFAGAADPGFSTHEVTVPIDASAILYVRVVPSATPSTVPVRIKVNHSGVEEVSRVITLDVS